MKSTRDQDLDFLTVKAEESQADSHALAVREQVYQQSKDSYLEKKRRELSDWIIRGLYAFQSASKDRKQVMAESEMNIDRIEREIKLYTSGENFQRTLAKAMAKISEKQAQVFISKKEKHERQKLN